MKSYEGDNDKDMKPRPKSSRLKSPSQHEIPELKPTAEPKFVLRDRDPRDEKRVANHTTEHKELSRVGSGIQKESKLKQPDALPKFMDKNNKSSSSTSASSDSMSRIDQPTKKVPPPPEKFHALHKGPILAPSTSDGSNNSSKTNNIKCSNCIAREESKDIGDMISNRSSARVAAHSARRSEQENDSSSIHTYRHGQVNTSASGNLQKMYSVQSLANEIRRIRSLKNEEEEKKDHKKSHSKKDKDHHNQEDKEAEEEHTKRKEKKTFRSKVRLQLSESIDLSARNEIDDMNCSSASTVPGCVQTNSPRFVKSSQLPLQQPYLSPLTLEPSPAAGPKSSNGKRGINRPFAQNLGLNFQLDLQGNDRIVGVGNEAGGDESHRMNKSYDLSASGTFDAVGFQIKQTGITRSPDRVTNTQPNNTKKHLIKLGILGRGASGVVHKALHVPSLLLVACKVIPVFENEKRHQLIAELKALYNNLSSLSDDGTPASHDRTKNNVACPEIVCLYDAFMNPNEGNVSIVVEYMDGGSLQDIVDTGGCKTESVLANISYRVLKGLAFLHGTHQLHRDIKPSNLLINHFGHVKISDFGIVKEMENSVAKATTFVGTLTYMSPERIASEEYSYKSDVWSFGLSIMTCALGKFPYSSKGGYWELLHMIRNEPPPTLPSDEFSDLFRDFLSKCLKKDQTERWSVKQLLQHEFLSSCREKDQLHSSECPLVGPGTLINQELDEELKQQEEKDQKNDQEREEEDHDQDNVEVDEIIRKVQVYYMKNAKELVNDHHYTFQDILAWIQSLPAMQKPKLWRFADQIGVKHHIVCQKFREGMNELLHDIQEQLFESHDADEAK